MLMSSTPAIRVRDGKRVSLPDLLGHHLVERHAVAKRSAARAGRTGEEGPFGRMTAIDTGQGHPGEHRERLSGAA
jgi:hypothetical protein